MIEAQYGLDQQQRLQLLALGRPGGKQWAEGVATAVSPVFLNIGGKLLNDSTPWELVSTNAEGTSRNGVRHVIRLRNVAAQAEVTLRLEMHPGQPFLRTYYSYRNLDQTDHTIQAARFFNLRLNTDSRPTRAFYVNQVRQGAPLNFNSVERNLATEPNQAVAVMAGAHADQCTWLALRDDADNGIAFGWEFDGRSRVIAQLARSGARVTVAGGPLDLNIPVAPGEEVTLPAGFLGLYEGDWDEAGYRTQRYAEAVLATRVPDARFPYLMYNTWGYQQYFDEDTLRRAARIAAEIGVEVFVVDLGWSRQIGEWEPDPVKFPSGLRALSDWVHSFGMKFGLHFVPAEAAPSAPVLEKNPDWTSSENDYYFESESMCLGHRPVQDWVRDSILNLIQTYNVDWFAQDGENLVKDCTKTTHTHNALNSNWANSVNGIDALIESVRARAPRTLWENNGDGGTMSTFEAVKRYATFGSCDACEHLPRRQAVYGMSYVFPPRFISRYMGELPIKFTTRSSMFGGPWILMQRLTELSQSDITLLRQEGEIYKSIRDIIRTGKVYHLLGRPDGYSIEAMQSFRPDQNRGVILVYRPDSPVSSTTIFPRGLNPAATYRVRFQENSDSISQTGALLMSGGIRVRLPNKLFAEIVYINGE